LNNKNPQKITEKCVLGKIGLHKAVSQFYKKKTAIYLPPHEKLQASAFHFANQTSAGLAVSYIPLSEV